MRRISHLHGSALFTIPLKDGCHGCSFELSEQCHFAKKHYVSFFFKKTLTSFIYIEFLILNKTSLFKKNFFDNTTGVTSFPQ